MHLFDIPSWVKAHIYDNRRFSSIKEETLEKVKEKLKVFRTDEPLATVVIPAYNEETELLNTLSSLAETKSEFPTDILIVNNGSEDRTQDILEALEVNHIHLGRNEGVSKGRQKGVEAAKGDIILNADADCIYPDHWAERFTQALLKKDDVSCVYGGYKFIPSAEAGRFSLSLHEFFAQAYLKRRKGKEESANVMGFNFAFRKQDCLDVGGFHHNLNRPVTGRSDDGWMALCLLEKGRIHRIENEVWSSNRRVIANGGPYKSLIFRLKQELSGYSEPDEK